MENAQGFSLRINDSFNVTFNSEKLLPSKNS